LNSGRNLDIEPYKNDRGFELIAEALGIAYPSKGSQENQ
jgi:hypothetical protein